MATLQPRNGRWRAIVRRKGHPTQSKTFPTKTAAKTWGDRIERELADYEARGGTPGENLTIEQLISWRIEDLASMKAAGATQTGNLTRLREGLGTIVARHLTANDVIEHARRRVQGNHMNAKGHIIPPCSAATMNVELGFLSELLKLAGPMKGVKLVSDPVAEARPVLRLLKLVGKSKQRDRRPTAEELQRLHAHFAAAEWRATIPMSDIITFAILTAKRESEITRLQWSDLDAANRTAMLRDAKHPPREDRQSLHIPPTWRVLGPGAASTADPWRGQDLPLQFEVCRHGFYSRSQQTRDLRPVLPRPAPRGHVAVV
ncbi:site-specific integrase [Stenotrophomonas maltophilia]|uniref:site-specific integrase n=1 Tax=Stenotrophomonas maltophilia TaxID=40324 RepID=UPI002E79A0B0|nr:site-specific integrase [Stenotrophomonas maltophilia]